MARARNIKPAFFQNEELVELEFSTRLLFIGLWTLADRAGRLEDRPKRIKMALFPADDLDIDFALSRLQDSGFIKRYTIDDNQYIQILAFEKHQNPHVKEPASIIPAPCEYGASTIQTPIQHCASHADSPLPITDSPLPTQAGRVCKKITDIGIIGINPSNPTLIALIESGATDEEFIYAAQKAKDSGKGFNYVLGIVKNAREEAKRLDLHQGELTKPMKGHGVISDADFKDWLEPKGKLING